MHNLALHVFEISWLIDSTNLWTLCFVLGTHYIIYVMLAFELYSVTLAIIKILSSFH